MDRSGVAPNTASDAETASTNPSAGPTTVNVPMAVFRSVTVPPAAAIAARTSAADAPDSDRTTYSTRPPVASTAIVAVGAPIIVAAPSIPAAIAARVRLIDILTPNLLPCSRAIGLMAILDRAAGRAAYSAVSVPCAIGRAPRLIPRGGHPPSG